MKIPFINQLVDNITDRFQNTDTMQAFANLADRSFYMFYTEAKQGDLKDSVQTLASQFGFDLDEAESEVQDIIHYNFAVEISLSEALISPTASAQFEVISKLVKIYKTLPPHTADCECDFFRMSLIKTELRNRLGEDSLDYLMRISINGPPSAEFPFVKAVQLWGKKRREDTK